MRISIPQIIILILLVFLLFGDLKKTKRKIKNFIEYTKRKIKTNRKKGT